MASGDVKLFRLMLLLLPLLLVWLLRRLPVVEGAVGKPEGRR